MREKQIGEFDIKFVNDLMSQIAMYKNQIVAANKILDEAFNVYKGLDNAMTPCSSVVDLLKLIQASLSQEQKKQGESHVPLRDTQEGIKEIK